MSTGFFFKNRKENKIIKIDDIMNMNFELNKDIIEAIVKEAFIMFDEDGSGRIDYREFKNVLKSLGYEMSSNKLYELMMKIDKSKSGSIDIEDFTEMMKENQTFDDSSIKLHLENTFNLYDKDQDGIISKEDFESVAKEVEDIFESEEASLIISFTKLMCRKFNKNDKNIKGITKEEFFHLLLNLGFIEEKCTNKVDLPSSKTKFNNMIDSKNTKNNSDLSEIEFIMNEK